MRLCSLLCFAVAVALSMTVPANSQAAVVVWDGTATTFDAFNQFNFNNATKTLAPFTADSITSITGDGFYHNHTGTTQTVNFEIFLDGSWTTLFTTTWPNNSFANINALTTPINFPSGVVSGIRFTSSPGSFQTFHFGSSSNNFLTFNFIQTPEPASLLAWGLLTGVGLVGYRLRRRKLAA